ncbi:hypothetical protein FRC12_003690 [Ceratobasidium sp. 428]|nr:hypothetical protein FRC12_003690 [Ceratobasidium sp. 428]
MTDVVDHGDSQVTQKHPKFYFNDTLITIQVESTIFNVHKWQLLKSETFRDMFSLANTTPDGGAKSMSSDEGSESNPIKLSGVLAEDFEKLLTMLYEFRFDEEPVHDASLLVPALRLANMWNFTDLRRLLIPLAEKILDDVDKIVCARESGVTEWLAPAHVRLCMRDTPLTKEEAVKVGLDSLLIISHLREKARLTPASVPPTEGCTCGSCRKLRGTCTLGASYVRRTIQAWIDSNFERFE